VVDPGDAVPLSVRCLDRLHINGHVNENLDIHNDVNID
jgi:hypothetical protein